MTDVNALNRLIEAKDAAALSALEALDDYCIEDDTALTPAAAAVRSGNEGALAIIAGSDGALEYFPSLGEESKRLISMQAGMVSSDAIEETEEYIGRSAGNEGNWERTPLLEACRHGNREAISLLVQAGARLNATDALKETALGLCLYHGRELARFFIECASERSAPFPVEDYVLADHLADAELAALMMAHGRLTKKATHLAFCIACGLLDKEEILRQLDAGYKLANKRPFGYDPLLEAATSKMLADHNHPEASKLAHAHFRSIGSPQAAGVLSSTPIEDLEAAIDALPPIKLDEDDAKWARRIESGLPQDIDPVLESDADVQRRLGIMDLLVERGLNPKQENPRDELMFLSGLVATNEPRLLEKLVELGVKFDPSELKNGDPVQGAIQKRCFSMVEPLVLLGSKIPKVESHWMTPYRQYLAWRELKGKSEPKAPKPKPPTGPDLLPKGSSFLPGQKAIKHSEASWETAGESMLAAVLIDGQTLRLSYSNAYCPLEGVELEVRLGDLQSPSREYADASDWIKPELVEDIVDVDGEFVPREEFDDPMGEHVWIATWEAELPVPEGKSRIELAVTSPMDGFDEPEVLSDWRIKRQ